ncbi:chloride channel protein [Gluconobacter morbifer]|nr:chloride channel protein [Gluconobacter morbifer]
MVRSDEIWLTVLAALVGVLSGLCVVAVTWLTLDLHLLLFGQATTRDGRLSGLSTLPPVRTMLVLTLGGVAVGLFGILAARLSPRRPVDPIEANALHGGRMSVADSVVLVTQNILSNGVGASIGLEAGFTQIASAFGSQIGRSFRVRREDLRVLVGAAAGAAIGAAFDAPVAGAFYAFELVIGSYSLCSLSPVAVAALAGVGTTRFLGCAPIPLVIPNPGLLSWEGTAGAMIIGILTALTAIGLMYAVTQTEGLFRRLPGPAWLRPAVGGLLVGGLAMIHPSALSAGHDAMRAVFAGKILPRVAFGLLLLKALASTVSIGAGFRGGLFFASLYLGTLAGILYGAMLEPMGLAPDSSTACALIGMTAMAVAIIGSPMTMICLLLELTGSVSMSGATLAAAVLSLLTVRRLFGYSFATWRFHLRGESIRSAVDIGWMRSLNVRRMMREQVRTLPFDTPVNRAQRLFPLGSAQRLVLLDRDGRYAGMVQLADLHAAPATATPVTALAHFQNAMLTPLMSIREAIELFAKAEADALVVVEDRESRQVVGTLTEQHALRRYAEELERSRRTLAGEESFPT